MPGKTNSASGKIRAFVVENFANVGEFKTVDVVQAMAPYGESLGIVTDSGYVSSALNGWSQHNLIVGGYRMKKNSDPGKGARWELAPANGTTTKKAMVGSEVVTVANSSKMFNAEVIHHDGASRLVKHEGKLYKVVPFKY